MEIKSNSLVSEIVRENFKTAQIFEKNNIDFCCGGNISLNEASEQANLKVQELIALIEPVMEEQDRDSKFIETLPLDHLCNYIEETHHL